MRRTWDREAIAALKGQEESIHLEFKRGSLFEAKSEDKWLDDVTKAISAFANTEGGTLILGLKEEKEGKTKRAGDPDGVPDSLSKEDLQRLIEGNLRPHLPGIHIDKIIFDSLPGRSVFAISVPQGSTAYQAKDRKYWGRSELESKALLDHEIRLRMARGHVAHARMEFRFRSVKLSSEQESMLRQRNTAAIEAYRQDPAAAFEKYAEAIFDLIQARSVPDVIELELLLRNDGELTIRDPVVTLVETQSAQLLQEYNVRTTLPSRIELTQHVLYPGDERAIDASLRFQCKREMALVEGDYGIRWKIFLDNSPPSFGELDLALQIQATRDGALL